MSFGDIVHHLSMVADLATHRKREVSVSVMYSWENNVAAYGDVQYVLPGSVVLDSEVDWPDYIAQVAVAGHLERVATYWQLWASSQTIQAVTGDRLRGLADFLLPGNVHIRPVQDQHQHQQSCHSPLFIIYWSSCVRCALGSQICFRCFVA